MDQSDAGSAGIFGRWTNQRDTRAGLDADTRRRQEAWVYSHYGPIRRRKCRYIQTMDQSARHTRGTRRRHAAPTGSGGRLDTFGGGAA
eukprot:40501-Prorocentrum_minimum.AAC.1